MSYTKMVRLFCDGPGCRREVYGETADDARRVASRLNGWYKVRKFGRDFCSEECETIWKRNLMKTKREAEKVSEARPGTLDAATVHHT